MKRRRRKQQQERGVYNPFEIVLSRQCFHASASLTCAQQSIAWGRMAAGLALPLLLPNVEVTFYPWLRQLIR